VGIEGRGWSQFLPKHKIFTPYLILLDNSLQYLQYRENTLIPKGFLAGTRYLLEECSLASNEAEFFRGYDNLQG
jgi:hypothetical protein